MTVEIVLTFLGMGCSVLIGLAWGFSAGVKSVYNEQAKKRAKEEANIKEQMMNNQRSLHYNDVKWIKEQIQVLHKNLEELKKKPSSEVDECYPYAKGNYE